jgi:hypothetical protein
MKRRLQPVLCFACSYDDGLEELVVQPFDAVESCLAHQVHKFRNADSVVVNVSGERRPSQPIG